jgi:tetratricopeptide (TPR) repeat protein
MVFLILTITKPADASEKMQLDRINQLVRQASEAEKQKNYDQAAKYYLQAIDMVKDSNSRVFWQFALISCYKQARKFEQAEKVARQIISHSAEGELFVRHDRERAISELGEIYVQEGKSKELKDLYDQKIKEEIIIWGPNSPRVANMCHQYALDLEKAGLQSEAALMHKRVNQIVATDKTTQEQQISCMRQREEALKAMAAGDLSKAESELVPTLAAAEKLGEWNVELPFCLIELASVKEGLKKHQQSAQLYERAIGLFKQHRDAYSMCWTFRQGSSGGSSFGGGTTNYCPSLPEAIDSYMTVMKDMGQGKKAQSIAADINKMEDQRRLSWQPHGGLSLVAIRVTDKDGHDVPNLSIKGASGIEYPIQKADGTIISPKAQKRQPQPIDAKRLATEDLGKISAQKERLFLINLQLDQHN